MYHPLRTDGPALDPATRRATGRPAVASFASASALSSLTSNTRLISIYRTLSDRGDGEDVSDHEEEHDTVLSTRASPTSGSRLDRELLDPDSLPARVASRPGSVVSTSIPADTTTAATAATSSNLMRRYLDSLGVDYENATSSTTIKSPRLRPMSLDCAASSLHPSDAPGSDVGSGLHSFLQHRGAPPPPLSPKLDETTTHTAPRASMLVQSLDLAAERPALRVDLAALGGVRITPTQSREPSPTRAGSGWQFPSISRTVRRAATLGRRKPSASGPLLSPLPGVGGSGPATLNRLNVPRASPSGSSPTTELKLEPGQFYSLPRSDRSAPMVVMRSLGRDEFASLQEMVASASSPLTATHQPASSLDRSLGGETLVSPTTAATTTTTEPQTPALVVPQLPEDTDRVVITAGQLKQLVPRLDAHPPAVRAMLGIRPLDATDGEVLELDLGQFIPLVALLSSSGAVALDHKATEAKTDLLYRLLLEGSSTLGVVDRDAIAAVVDRALAANSLYLDPADVDALVDVLLARLDVDRDGVVSHHDFTLVTRQWDLSRIGLPLAPTIAGGRARDVDLFENDYLAATAGMPMSPTLQGFAGPTSRTTGSGDGGPVGRSRASYVKDASQWLLRRSSQIFHHTFEPTPPPPTKPAPVRTEHRGSAASSSASSSAPSTAPERQPPTQRPSPLQSYLKLEGPKLACVALFTAAGLTTFLYQFVKYASVPAVREHFGLWVSVAKGSAHLLMLTLALQFLLVCRTALTAMRSVPGLNWIPINKHIVWHRYCGFVVVAASAVHTLCHVAGSFPALAGSEAARAVVKLPPVGYWDLMLLSIPGSTGWALVVLFGLLAATSTVRFRRWHFDTFFTVHHLFVLIVVLLLLHGAAQLLSPPAAWKYLVGPVAVYAGERFLRVWRSRSAVPVLHARIQADTLVLVLERPAHLGGYVSGQYVFLNIPSISRWQWHPFTLTSASADPFLSLRVKRAGDWTGALFDLLAPMAETVVFSGSGPGAGSRGDGAAGRQQHQQRVLQRVMTLTAAAAPAVYVDGPFGAASQEFFEYDQVMFIATGVGATPFLSILKQIEYLVQEQQPTGPSKTVPNGNDPEKPGTDAGWTSAVRRVDFFWINRDQRGFKWMAEVLRGVDPRARRVLRVHTFLTCAADGSAELSSFLLWWGLRLLQRQRGGVCPLTGLEDSTVVWGRPDWASIFQQTARLAAAGCSRTTGSGKVGVFFCGPKPLGKEIYGMVREMNATSDTFFVFAKENF
ncbi:hypothetical protein H9P43_008955 [Blastocladiella emersonii ATCC 22665]|nr:hypothetical protein H9P43_008947 [Blastocladiella emersonii ATCC 22665]KAI9155845.1 hypothetical protein H9P43_008955 [Blastocladiella emersonii ATCC 22665]